MEALKKIILAIIYLFAAFGFVAVVNHNSAHAAYEIVKLDLEHKETKVISHVIHVRGDFDDGITRDLKNALEANPNIDRIAFDSPGGSAHEAFSMANLLSESQIRVWVPKARICLSACAIAFTGGYDYKVEGTLGFHNAWISLDPLEEATHMDVTESYIGGQQLGTYATGFFNSNGFSFNLQYDIAQNTDAEKFLVFNSEEEFLDYYVRNDNDPSMDLAINYWQEPKENLKIWNNELTDYRNKQIDELDASGGTYNVLKVTEIFSSKDGQQPDL